MLLQAEATLLRSLRVSDQGSIKVVGGLFTYRFDFPAFLCWIRFAYCYRVILEPVVEEFIPD